MCGADYPGALTLDETLIKAFHQTDDKLREAVFAPSKPQSGLTEMHENQSLTARRSRDLLLIFEAADFVRSLRKRFNQRFPQTDDKLREAVFAPSRPQNCD